MARADRGGGSRGGGRAARARGRGRRRRPPVGWRGARMSMPGHRPIARATARRGGTRKYGGSPRQQAELTRMHATGEYTIADLMEVFSVGRATIYRTLERT